MPTIQPQHYNPRSTPQTPNCPPNRRTIGGRDVIDPTGTLREIHGSQHTVLKDWSFGLGLNPRDDVLDKVAALYASHCPPPLFVCNTLPLFPAVYL